MVDQQSKSINKIVFSLTFISGSNTDPGIVLFEGLAASGLRSIRYALEVPGIEEIVASDISSDAFQLMAKNVMDNQVSHIVKPLQMDARYSYLESLRLYRKKCRRQIHWID